MAMTGSASVVDRAQEIVAVLQDGRPFAEEKARIAPEVLAACRDAGLFAMAAPREVGGVEATLAEMFEALVVVAAADPSAAWVALNSQICARLAAAMDPALWDDVYQSPLGPFGWSAAATGRLRQTDSGYILSGSWPLMTGVLDAKFAAVVSLLRQGEELVARQVVIPTSQLAINEVWQNAVAMRGTGSHEVSAADIFVPAGMVFDMAPPTRIDRPLYRCPPFGLVGAVNAAVPVGILQAAVDSAGSILRDKVGSIFGQKASDSTALQELIAEAWMSLGHLRLGITSALTTMDELAERREEIPLALRATVTGGPFQAAAVARDLISRLYTRSSRAAFFAGHPLERAMRDIHAVGYGLETIRPLHHDVGRVAMGLDPVTPSF
jgi:alkylation response protein AidB-like acyl-CoA dehydrogenase